jgi:hypothetical protein
MSPLERKAPGTRSSAAEGMRHYTTHTKDSTTRAAVDRPARLPTLDALLGMLEGVHRCGRGYVARCPSHDDRTASLSIGEGHESRILLRCFAGCSAADVVHSLGLEVRDLFPPRGVTSRP